MRISICVRKHEAEGRSFYGATARKGFLKGVKGIDDAEENENFVVKMTAGSANLPADEGVFLLEGNFEAWLDRREGVKCGALRVIRVKGNPAFAKKCDFKKD